MHIVVEVGDWEHECCGPAYERNTVIDVTCLVFTGPDGVVTPFRESHHDPTTRDLVHLRGRVADLCIQHLDGSTERIDRLPSGMALRGFDVVDDGHLEQPWTGDPVVNDSNRFLLTIAG